MMKKMFWIGPKNSSNQMKNKMKFKCTPTLNLKYYFVVLIFSFSSVLIAKTDLYPTAIMKHETQWLVRLLEQEHYNKVKVGDLNTTDFINNFLKKLDKQKLYFTEGEIEEFHKRYQTTVIPHLTNGNLLPGFEMYNLYQQKAISRLNWVLSELNNEPELFNDDNFTNNRNESPWVENEDQLNEIWRDLISSEYIRDILQQLDENVTNIQENSNLLPEYISSARKSISKSYSKWIENIREFEASDVQEIYLTTLTQMFDPHTTFLNIKEKERFDQAMNNEFVGIGARLQDEDGYCTIKELLPGGPAEACRQLEPEDIILRVAQSEGEFVDVVDMKLTKIVELIKGPKNTLVRLEVRPIKNPSSRKEVRIVRDRIKLTENLAKAYVKQISLDDEIVNVGIIELPSFYGSSGKGPKATDDVEELISKLKTYEIKCLVLDLRRNGGGYLSEAVNLTGLFINRGPVVQVKSTDGKIRKKFDFNPKISWNGPLFTLVSRYSASASEIVAGALQDHNRAIIIGDESTHGKGTVQSMIQMNLPFNFLANRNNGKTSAAKITIQKYYLPSGNSTQINGVKSDISIPSINMSLPVGESDLENALSNDTIAAVNFRKTEDQYSIENKTIKNLQNCAEERRKNSDSFSYLKQNIEFFTKRREQKSLSLNLSTRIDEKKRDRLKSEQLSDELESLNENSYPFKTIKLDIVEDQLSQSRKARGVDDTTDANEFEKPSDFDLSLNETLNIVKDYLKIKEPKSSALNEIEKSQEI